MVDREPYGGTKGSSRGSKDKIQENKCSSISNEAEFYQDPETDETYEKIGTKIFKRQKIAQKFKIIEFYKKNFV